MWDRWKWITGILLLVHLALFGLVEIGDSDAWGHALLGRILCEEGRIPCFSDYSWIPDDTTPRPVVCGIQIVLYLTLHYAGYAGLLLLRFVVLFFVCYFLWRLMQLHGVPWPVFILCSMSFLTLGYSRFLPRGDFFNLLFWVVYCYLLEKFLRQPGKWILWMVLLQAVWCNIHQLSLLGIGLIGLYAGYCFTNRMWRRCLQLLGLAVLCAAMLIATPAGVTQFVNLWQMSGGSPELTAHIGEFIALPDVAGPVTTSMYWAMLGTVLLLSLVNRSWQESHHLALLLGFALGSWQHVRLIGMFALEGAYVAGKAIWHTCQRYSYLRLLQTVRLRAIAYTCLLTLQLVLAVSLVSGHFFAWNQSQERCRPCPSETVLPVKAVKFLQKHQVTGNIYTDYNVGSYVGYHLYPAVRLFMHSLCLYYSLENYRLYSAIAEGTVNPTSVILPYHIELFVINHNQHENYALVRWLFETPDWLLVYADETTLVFAAAESPFVRRNKLVRIELASMRQKPDIAGSASKLVDIGNLMLDIACADEAEAAALQALKLDPDQAVALSILGMVECMRGDWYKALSRFVASAESDSSYVVPRQNIQRLFAQCIRFEPHNPLHQKARKLAGK